VEPLEARELLSTFALHNNGTLVNGATIVATNVAAFHTDTAGNLYALKTNGALYELKTSKSLSLLDTGVSFFNVDANGTLIDLKDSGKLMELNAHKWSLIGSNVEEANLTAGGTVDFLQTDGSLKQAAGTATPTLISANVISFRVGGTENNTLAYLQSDGTTQPQLVAPGIGTFSPTPGTNYGVDSFGNVDFVGFNSFINATSLISVAAGVTALTDVPGTNLALSADGTTTYWINNTQFYSTTVGLIATAAANSTFTSVAVGGDNAGYAVEVATNGASAAVTHESLLMAAAGASTATLVDGNVNLATPFALAPNGNLYVLETNGTVKDFNVAHPNGRILDTSVAVIQTASDGAFYEQRFNGTLRSLTAAGWSLVNSGVHAFQVANNGALFELQDNSNFLKMAGGVQTLVSNAVVQFSIAQDGALEYMQTGGTVWLATRSTYNPTGPIIVAINAVNGAFINPQDDVLTASGANSSIQLIV